MINKYAEFDGQPQKPIKVWRAALYIRLSREDEDNTKIESNSVTSQREFLGEFLKQHPDIELYDYYVDDGWSGTNFNRPDFQRMMADVYAKRVDCVIVNDLSRLGRNAAETSNYIDNIFAREQIRFIAVHNYIDTVESKMNAATHCITVGIQNVINESVAATTSVNVRGTLNVERQQGKFIGSFACYGYIKDPEDKHKLIIDEEAAKIVRRIFDWYIGGMGVITIAKELNEMGIPNPSKYKQLKGMKYNHPSGKNNDGLWPDSSVRRILKNEMYIGNMVQGINTTISFKHKQCISVPKENWYVVEGTHEPIVDKETFYKAQALFNKGIRHSGKKKEADLFSGLVRCSDCHRLMYKKTNKFSYGTYNYYRCSTNAKMKTNSCGNHNISFSDLEEAVTLTIQQMVEAATQMSQIVEKISNNPKRNVKSLSLDKAMETAKKEREKILNAQNDLYPDWKSGELTKEEYIRLKANLSEKLTSIEESINNIEKTIEDYNQGITKENEFIAGFKKYGNFKKLNRSMVTELISEIIVYKDKKIEVNFNFMDAYKEVLEYIEINKDDTKNIA